MDNKQTEMTMYALATIAEAGGAESYTNDSDTAEKIYGDIIAGLLLLDAATLSSWVVVWGPAIFSFPINLEGQFVDNVIYVVRNGTSNDYAIAIAGTNVASVADWIFEDLLVGTTMPWSMITGVDPGDGTKPNISLATFNALLILCNISPPAQAAPLPIPGSGQTLEQFLRTITGGDKVNLYVTGHSLGGALSPALALMLADLAGSWDLQGNATLRPYSFAGPTPGDAGFVTHFANKIPAGLQRIWNKLDVVPHAWDQTSLNALPNLYGSTVSDVADAVTAIEGAIKNIKYAPVNDAKAAFSGPQQTSSITTRDAFQQEAAWQHTLAYTQYYGLPTDTNKSSKARKTGG